MATYQFIVELIPEKWVKKTSGRLDLLYDEAEMYDTCIAWKQYPLSNNFERSFSEILPMAKSWHQSLQIWGDQQKNDIQIWTDDDNQIESIKFRLDLREDIEDFVVSIIKLAIELNCLLFLPDSKEIIDPNVAKLKELINLSSAAKFVKSPLEYLSKKK